MLLEVSATRSDAVRAVRLGGDAKTATVVARDVPIAASSPELVCSDDAPPAELQQWATDLVAQTDPGAELELGQAESDGTSLVVLRF